MASDSNLFHVAGTPPAVLRIARPLRVLTEGSHHPLVCMMERDGGSAGAWVVKQQVVLSASTSYGAFSTVAELAGAEVCAWVGLSVPAIGLTSFPQELDKAALLAGIASLDEPTRVEIVEIFSANRGKLAFCAALVDPAATLAPDAFARTKLTRAAFAPDAAALFVADAFMFHADREHENPNALRYRGRTVAIDHNLAFSLLARAGESGHGAALITRPHDAFKRHVVRRFVEDASIDAHLDVAIGRLEAITDSRIEALIESWPRALDHEPGHGIAGIFERYRKFLRERRAHVRAFVTEACAMLRGQS